MMREEVMNMHLTKMANDVQRERHFPAYAGKTREALSTIRGWRSLVKTVIGWNAQRMDEERLRSALRGGSPLAISNEP
ncbi:MAG: hypothetical protein D6820_12055 [Lentisphaerae bacterium]|nr:MAG: hypothetical protein D6820_12055 [Lentisphaerota bacterium]